MLDRLYTRVNSTTLLKTHLDGLSYIGKSVPSTAYERRSYLEQHRHTTLLEELDDFEKLGIVPLVKPQPNWSSDMRRLKYTARRKKVHCA